MPKAHGPKDDREARFVESIKGLLMCPPYPIQSGERAQEKGLVAEAAPKPSSGFHSSEGNASVSLRLMLRSARLAGSLAATNLVGSRLRSKLYPIRRGVPADACPRYAPQERVAGRHDAGWIAWSVDQGHPA